MKLVVHGANWVGDAIMTIPALRELRRAFSDASITLYSRPWAGGVFQDCDFIDEVMVAGSGESIRKSASRWRAAGFDAALLFTNSFQTALIARLAGVPVRVGYSVGSRGILLSDAVKVPAWKKERHEVYFYLELARAFEEKLLGTSTVSAEAPDTRLEVSDTRKEAARQMLSKLGAGPGPVIGFGVGSQNSTAKRWMAAGYAKLIDLLAADPGATAVLLGSDMERPEALEVSGAANTAPIDLVGETGLPEAVAVISVCDLFVSNDMGLSHAASAVGTKTLTIFGPTNPLTTRPWNGEIIIRDDVDCSPCMLRECPIDHRCMERIEPSYVHEKAKALLGV